MLSFVITIIVAGVSGYFFYKIKVPGGMMVGAIVGVVIFNLISGAAVIPYECKLATQIVSGAFIGVGIERDDLKNLIKLVKPACILVVGMFLLNIIMGIVIYITGPMDLKTAFFCAVPGGMTDTPIIATEMGADGGIVAIMQFVRLSSGIGLFPSIINYFGKNEYVEDKGDIKIIKTPYTHKGFFAAIGGAIIGGILGKVSGVPAGALLMSLISSILLKQIYPKCMLPVLVRRIAQVMAGAYIATGIRSEDLSKMKLLVLPAILMILGYLGACILIGVLIKKYGGLTVREGMLAATPAGASDMALIAADIGVNSPDVIVLQICRMVSAIIFFPQIIMLILSLLS